MASQFSDTCIYSGIKWPLHECFETCPRSAEDVDVGCLINDAIDLFVDRQFVVSIRGVLHEDLGASTLRLIATDDFLHLSTRVFHRRRTKENYSASDPIWNEARSARMHSIRSHSRSDHGGIDAVELQPSTFDAILCVGIVRTDHIGF